jgi:probable F420-dependent oxidoreductase
MRSDQMKIDGSIGFHAAGSGHAAKEIEALGYDGVWAAETTRDPFLPLAIAASETDHLELGTSIAVAFARNPMNLAVIANDLQELSNGRFILGLGSQIKAHITRRFSMEWSHPAPRMREMLFAIRAIWDSWANGTKLDFRGDFYSHTLMTPMFDPGPNPHGNPKIIVAAVGELMTEVAGEAGDGMIVHGFSTQRYLREVTIPALERGAAKAGKTRKDLIVAYPGFIVTGEGKQFEEATVATKRQIAFYGSTPAYRPVLALHGWGEVGDELNIMSKRGEWVEMGELITDEMLDAFAVVGPLDEIPDKVGERFGELIDRFSFYAPYRLESDRLSEILERFKRI